MPMFGSQDSEHEPVELHCHDRRFAQLPAHADSVRRNSNASPVVQDCLPFELEGDCGGGVAGSGSTGVSMSARMYSGVCSSPVMSVGRKCRMSLASASRAASSC